MSRESQPTVKRRFFATEVVQTSPMDCGPAALASLLAGFGLRASYGRLREACQTDVDGTSIDTLCSVANELGLDSAQILVPSDHVASADSHTLPAIAVVRLPGGANHFVVLWRRVGDFVQVMDPGHGRRWLRMRALRRSLYEHGIDMPAESWRRFAASPTFVATLARAMRSVGHRDARTLVERALQDATWRSIATLDAATRMVRSLVDAGSVARGSEAARLLESLYETTRGEDLRSMRAIPAAYWIVRPHGPRADGRDVLHVRGALLVHARGPKHETHGGVGHDAREVPRLAADVAASIRAEPAHAARALVAALRADGALRPSALFALVLLSSFLVLGQALVFRALFDLGGVLGLAEQRLAAIFALLVFVGASIALDLPMAAGCLRLGRHVEARLRIAFQRKIPRLSERFFGSRPNSDMAERAHGLVVLRNVPTLAFRCVRIAATLVLTALGLVWLDPSSAVFVVCAVVACSVLPFVFQRALTERELALRSHHGALTRFYLDALLGLVAVRVHGAEPALRREHESLLVEWTAAGMKLARAATLVRATSAIAGFGIAAVLVARHAANGSGAEGALLYAFWALSLPMLGEQMAQIALQLPAMRNATMRALEPLGAIEDARSEAMERAAVNIDEASAGTSNIETRKADATAHFESASRLKAAGVASSAAHTPGANIAGDAQRSEPAGCFAPSGAVSADTRTPRVTGVSIAMRNVSLVLGGHTILAEVELDLRPGEHVAIVGRSGAGKSSLLGLWLGWTRASSGTIDVDGTPLDTTALEALRRKTAWVDPSAQIWNRSLFENLVYGSGATSAAELSRAIEDAELGGVFESLPAGLETSLGEGGGFLSGGEGQRVRLARAFLRDDVRFAVLDEPFRGLDRERRRALLAKARARWRDATLVCATHDLDETRAFDRVIVVDAGRIVEDGHPALLAARASSLYARLLDAERAIQAEIWSDPAWTRWRVERGHVEIVSPTNEAEP